MRSIRNQSFDPRIPKHCIDLATENVSRKGHVHIVRSVENRGLPGFRNGVIYTYSDMVVMAARRMSSFSLVSSQTRHLIASMLSDKEFVWKYLTENSKRLRKRHEMFFSGLRLAGINCLDSNAGLFYWVDLRHFLQSPNPEGGISLWKTILKDIRLNVSPGSSFHCSESRWFRFLQCQYDRTHDARIVQLDCVLYPLREIESEKPIACRWRLPEFPFWSNRLAQLIEPYCSVRSMESIHSKECLRPKEATRLDVTTRFESWGLRTHRKKCSTG